MTDTYGPNTVAVQAVLDHIPTLTLDKLDRLAKARYAAQSPAQSAVRDAAWCAAREAAREARSAVWPARQAAWYAVWEALHAARPGALSAAWLAIADIVMAVLVRDLISPEHFAVLVKPWLDAGLPAVWAE